MFYLIIMWIRRNEGRLVEVLPYWTKVVWQLMWFLWHIWDGGIRHDGFHLELHMTNYRSGPIRVSESTYSVTWLMYPVTWLMHLLTQLLPCMTWFMRWRSEALCRFIKTGLQQCLYRIWNFMCSFSYSYGPEVVQNTKTTPQIPCRVCQNICMQEGMYAHVSLCL